MNLSSAEFHSAGLLLSERGVGEEQEEGQQRVKSQVRAGEVGRVRMGEGREDRAVACMEEVDRGKRKENR